MDVVILDTKYSYVSMITLVNDNSPYKYPKLLPQTFSIHCMLSHIAQDLLRFCKQKEHWSHQNQIAECRQSRYQ